MRISLLPSGGHARLGARRTSSAVALDIGADCIVALQSPGSERAKTRCAIVHPLPLGVVVDGEVVDPERLATELRVLFDEHKLPRDVRVGLAHPRLMVRLVELPGTLAGTDLDLAVRQLGSEALPVGLDQLVVDYRRVGRSPDGSGVGQQRVLVAAARVDSIERLTHALESAHLRVQHIHLSGLAMMSALDHPPLRDEAVLYVQAGALTNVVISEDGQPQLVRAASTGSEAIAAGLAERARISHDTARRYTAVIGVQAAQAHATPAPIAAELEAHINQQVREGLRRIVAEVQASRGVYSARPDARPIGAVVLTGAMTTWPGVAAALKDELSLPVIPAGRSGWPELGGAPIAPERLDVAVGLARAAHDERPDLRPTQHGAGHAAQPVGRIAQVACAALAVLSAAIVYAVIVSNQVSSGRDRLGQISTQLVQTEREAATLKPYYDFAKATVTRRDAVTTVAKSRFNWDRALTELAQVAPGGVWLTSATGTLAPNTAIDGAGSDGATTGLRSALSQPALELAGCATRERGVPAYIDRLQSITGVSEVAFSRSERLEKSAATKSTGAGGGDCRNGDSRAARFALVTYFKPTPAQAAAALAAAQPPAGVAATPPGQPATPPGQPAPPPGQPASAATAPPNQTAAAPTGGTR